MNIDNFIDLFADIFDIDPSELKKELDNIKDETSKKEEYKAPEVKELPLKDVPVFDDPDKLQDYIDHYKEAMSSTNEVKPDAPNVNGDLKSSDAYEYNVKYPENAQELVKRDVLVIPEDVHDYGNGSDFYLHNHVKDTVLSDGVDITFAHQDEDFYVPGITEKQLIKVLIDRFENQKEHYFANTLKDIYRNL